jgi:hypothetical protein
MCQFASLRGKYAVVSVKIESRTEGWHRINRIEIVGATDFAALSK